MPSKFTPTDEQDAIIAAVADPSGTSVMVEAGAGCAKSATLELAAPGVRQPALALAFNRSIAQELKPRLPSNFEVKTFNGLGYGAWMRANPQVKRWEMDDRKIGKLVSQLAKDRQQQLSSDQWDQARRLVSAAQLAGISPGDMGAPLTPDLPEEWLTLAEDCWISADDAPQLIELAHEVLSQSIELARRGTLCFDDQIYCPTVLGGKFPRYPRVFSDESQDLNRLNHEMLRQSLAADGRLTAVGDSRQAIYAFRGADSDSMRNLRRVRQQWTDRQLTMTFRCPRAVVARQLEHFPAFRAAASAAEGQFATVHSLDDSPENVPAGALHGWDIPRIKAQHPTGRSLAVLCRNNAPLLSLAFKLIRGGTGVQMLGRDIGKGLQQLSRKIVPQDATPADATAGAIADWMTREESLARANGKEERVSRIRDQGESLLACLEGSGARDAGELRAVIDQLFSRSAGQIVLSSIHRAKGLEWDTVVHLDPWRIPSKFAKRMAAEGDHSQLRQEWNLRYVCETRTRHTLVNANLEDFEA